jgi:hypothetical protein
VVGFLQHATAGHESPAVVRIIEAYGKIIEFLNWQYNKRRVCTKSMSVVGIMLVLREPRSFGSDVDGHNKPSRALTHQNRRDPAQQQP